MPRAAKATPTLPTFARRLIELRQAAGLTTYALAKDAGITPSQLGRLERGERG